MSELTKFECDATGELYGARNFVLEVEVRKKMKHSTLTPSVRTFHLSFEKMDEHEIVYPVWVNYIDVKMDGGLAEKVIGISIEEDNEEQYYPRGEGGAKKYEEFFQFLEAEVLH